MAVALPGRGLLALVGPHAVLLGLALGTIIIDDVVLVGHFFLVGSGFLVAAITRVLHVSGETHETVVFFGLLVDFGVAVGWLGLLLLDGGGVRVAVQRIRLLLHHSEEVLLELDKLRRRVDHQLQNALHLHRRLQILHHIHQKLLRIVGYFLHQQAVEDGQGQLFGRALAVDIVVPVHPHHLQRQYFDESLLVEADVFGGEGGVGAPVDADHFADPQGARAQHRPHLFLVEDFALVVALLDFSLQRVVEVLVEEGYFVEGGAEGVFEFGVGAFEVQDVLVLFGQLLGEVDERLLVGLLVRERVLFEEVQSVAARLLHDRTVRRFAEHQVLSARKRLSIAALSHLKIIYNGN